MKSALQPSAPPVVIDRSMNEILDALGRETGDLRRTAERLQHMAGDLIERASLPANDPLIEEAQALDALAQKLDALTGFLERLGETAPDDWRLDIAQALAPVLLADLAKRLSREHHHEADPASVSGDCELF